VPTLPRSEHGRRQIKAVLTYRAVLTNGGESSGRTAELLRRQRTAPTCRFRLWDF
jgi:hypothetical protein